MIMTKIKIVISTLLLSLACTNLALAAGTATINSDGDLNTIIWQDTENIVFEPETEDSSPFGRMIIKDGNAYAIQEMGGSVQVMETSSIMHAMGGIMEGMDEELGAPKILQLKDAKKTEEVAGITGHVYLLDVEEDGKEETIEAVFTDNKAAVELTEVYMSFIKHLLGPAFAKELTNIQASFPNNRKGVLRFGDDLKLVSLDSKTPDDELFELPAEPTSMQNLMQQMMEQMSE